MAADQRKKRQNAPSITSSSRDQHKFKRKKLSLPQHDLDMRSYISLQWDDGKKSVVAKREQVGISRRELIPFVNVRPPGHNVLADVVTVPREIFGLENLAKVLTYEVWQGFLSENERNLLAQFLPKDADPDEVVQRLLGRDNFHFGNPFSKWGSLLCSGNYHPDNIVYSEQCFKASKKAYYMDLRKYHNDMIENLQLWKERLASCEDPEEEIVHRIWRKGSASSALDNSSDGVKVAAKPSKGEKLLKRNIQHGDGTKYMSYIKVSKAQHQRVKSSMKHNSNSIQPKSLNNVLGNIEALHVQPFEVYEEEVRRRLHDHWLQVATRDLPVGFTNWRERQSQRLQLTKSLGVEIETRLNSETESADQGEEKESSHDMPPETMDDEDAGTDDTPTMMEEEGVAPSKPPEAPLMTTESEEQQSDGSDEEQTDSGSANTEQLEGKERAEEDFASPQQSDTGTSNSVSADDNSVLVPTESEHLEHTVSHDDGHPHYDNMIVETQVDHFNEKAEEASPDEPYPENLNSVDVPMNQEDTLTSSVDTWQPIGIPASYYNSTSLNREYSSVRESPLAHQQVEEQPTQIINLQADHREKDVGKDILQRHPDDMSFFSPYPNQDRNELLHSLFKSQSNLPYQHEQKQSNLPFQHEPKLSNLPYQHEPKQSNLPYQHEQKRSNLPYQHEQKQSNLPYQHEQKQPELEFQPATNLIIEAGQFSGHMREHIHCSQALDLRHKGLGDFYMHQNIPESMYSDGGRYSLERQENSLPLNVHDWSAVTTVRMSTPAQSHGNGSGLLNQNWFPGENQARGSWPCMEGTVVSSQNNIGSGSNNDQSLFSVLSECSDLRHGAASAAYDSMNSAGRFMQSGNYASVSGPIHTASSVLQPTSNPLSYLSGHEAAAGFKTTGLAWMNTQHQTPSLEETMPKPYRY